ncbi:ATP-binding protein [Streptomyces sp. NPDC059786]|uniref:ATP-binding protein n=1 Tax=Streptomyces sp. NPDC059786 TaxID=3346946 RepID=UPI0036602708
METRTQLLRARTARYPRDRRSVGMARDLTRSTLTDWRITRRGDDIILCVSELATNAVLHGVPPGRCFDLGLALAADGVLEVEVRDSGGGAVRESEPGPDALGGRGLHLVRALADDWGVRVRDPGKVVWCAFRVVDGPVPA